MFLAALARTEGTPDQVRSNPEVIRAYLGQEADEVLEAS